MGYIERTETHSKKIHYQDTEDLVRQVNDIRASKILKVSKALADYTDDTISCVKVYYEKDAIAL